MWHKAKKVSLVSGQTEVKIEFPLPIVACNLMIEYADFYENIQASSETLQCPRCSASVPANPGVCANCGENVFQCHKCRFVLLFELVGTHLILCGCLCFEGLTQNGFVNVNKMCFLSLAGPSTMMRKIRSYVMHVASASMQSLIIL